MMKHRNLITGSFWIVLFFVIITGYVLADVKLPSVIGDNMVLQQQMQVPIWGWANPGENVTVTGGWSPMAVSVKADKDGKWMVKIQTPLAGTGAYNVTIEGNNKIVLKNVLIGEVWICSGQSNMQWTVAQSTNGEEEVVAADYPNIRLFTVPRKTSQQPQEDCKSQWEICSPKTVPWFSAVGYFFGRDLYKKINVPIGLINTSYGGTPAEAWTKREALVRDSELRGIVEDFNDKLKTYPQVLAKHKEKIKQWQEDQKKPESQRNKDLKYPSIPYGPDHQSAPSGLYNAMIHPLVPFGIRGAIWYQGESNASGMRAVQYYKLFSEMIKGWRQSWNEGDFPFYFVQLANFTRQGKSEAERKLNDWAYLRESQLKTLSLANTGMAVIIDIGESNDIHPKNKQDVGKRLALWGLAKTYGYGDNIVYSGPIYKKFAVEGNKIVISFNHVGGGLIIKGGDKLKGFEIAGQDQKFLPAEATITENGEAVMVSSNDVTSPVAVRYAWADDPICNLFNKEDLPASPFRTDDWPFEFKEEK